jgi:hypothetical protein
MTSDAQILAPRGAGDEGVDPRRWLTLIILLLAAFMNLLDPHRVIASAGGSAVRDDFVASLERTLWFQVGVFLLAFLLMLAQPRGAGRRAAEQPAAAETVPALAEGIVTQ